MQQSADHERATAQVELFDPRRFAFLFDVDGTLLDIAPTPNAVQVPSSLLRDLELLSAFTGGATALVSGRSLDDLERLFGTLRLAMVGGHGAEVRVWHDGRPEQHSPPPIDASIRARLNAIKMVDSRLFIEDKGYSVALHYRLAPERQQVVRKMIDALKIELAAQHLAILDGKAVFEIKRTDVDKGAGVRKLMAQTPFEQRRPIYVGDDTTDEDAIAALPEFDGIGISVGRDIVGATRQLADPSAVRRWIAAMVDGYDQYGASAR